MPCIHLISGPCGSGKSTLSDAYARHLVDSLDKKQVYVIHGDNFHAGFAETARRVDSSCPGFLYWPDILRFNWDCILSVADKALVRGLDVVIDYVVEDELPLVEALAERHGVQLHYFVLTTSEDDLRQRLDKRGSSELIDRSLFLKRKLEAMPENQGHMIGTSGKTPTQIAAEMAMLVMEKKS